MLDFLLLVSKIQNRDSKTPLYEKHNHNKFQQEDYHTKADTYYIDDSEIGVCPCCGNIRLVYGKPYVFNSQFSLPWECPVCGVQGEEVYVLEFEGQYVF